MGFVVDLIALKQRFSEHCDCLLLLIITLEHRVHLSSIWRMVKGHQRPQPRYIIKADSHIAYRAHAVPMSCPCGAHPMPFR